MMFLKVRQSLMGLKRKTQGYLDGSLLGAHPGAWPTKTERNATRSVTQVEHPAHAGPPGEHRKNKRARST